MKSGAARVAETAFISTETFTQKTFKRWVENRPRGDINRYELASGRILMTPPAAWEHAKIEAKVIRILEDSYQSITSGRFLGPAPDMSFPPETRLNRMLPSSHGSVGPKVRSRGAGSF
jgi:Uma2 family endonuclease